LMRARASLLSVLLLILPGASALRGQEESAPARPHPGESLTVSLLTIGQGELFWERFGHNAIVIREEGSGQEIAYHWGVFSFSQDDFLLRLAKGTMLYSMGTNWLDDLLLDYQRAGRPVWVQELDLTPEQRWELRTRVRENAQPENREYRYDYYQDNCSTRLRDHLDAVLGGALSAGTSSESTPYSFRWHTRRLLRDLPGYYLGIQFVLGPNGDRPISVWEEMFLPFTLRDQIRDLQISDSTGGTRPLVANERLVLESDRADPPSSVPFAFPLFLLVGVLWGGAFLWLVSGGPDLGKARRLGVFILAGGWSLLAALSGTLLLLAWMFTDHFFWYENYNLFQVNPFFLPLVGAFLAFLFTGRFSEWGKNMGLVVGVLAVLGVALELIPGLGQRNPEILGLTLPVNVALLVGSVRLYRFTLKAPPTDEGFSV
jgi:hypothetical protein